MRDLIRVGDVEQFTTKGGKALFVIQGKTTELIPSFLRLLTWKPFEASLCERAKIADRLVWVEYTKSPFAAYRHKEHNLTKVELDTTHWQHEGEAS